MSEWIDRFDGKLGDIAIRVGRVEGESAHAQATLAAVGRAFDKIIDRVASLEEQVRELRGDEDDLPIEVRESIGVMMEVGFVGQAERLRDWARRLFVEGHP